MKNSLALSARETVNANHARTSGASAAQSSLRDYGLFSHFSRHCAALRAGLITVAAPRLNDVVQPSRGPRQDCHTGAKAHDKKERLFAGLKPRASTGVHSSVAEHCSRILPSSAGALSSAAAGYSGAARAFGGVLFTAAILAAVLVFTGAAAAQQKKDDPNAKIPRAADGHPDMTGVWQGGSNRIGTWEEANVDGGFVPGNVPMTPFAIKDKQPPPPYQAWAQKKVDESYARRGVDEPMVRCLPPGVPRTTLMGLFPMQIVQTPKMVVMLFEVFHEFRLIPIDAKHPNDLDPSYMGDSVGHWDGDTLVVDVTGFNDKTWLSGVGTIHSEKLHVVEKFTRVDMNTILYEDTVEDPVVFTGPWTRHGTIMLRPGTRLQEYECVENNDDLVRYNEMLKDESVFRRKQ
jgi:hypothetical protein